MALAAAPQEPALGGGPSRVNSFSQAAAAAAASMASIFPHQVLFHHGSCKVAASAPVLTFNAMESTISQFEAEEMYDFTDESTSLFLESKPVQTIGAGLANLGNTCFLNSVLQCLSYTPPLAAHLQSGLHSSSCKATGFCAMCGLERHVREALASNGRTVSPNYLVKNLRCISRSFQSCRQEDAHEYMRYLIEALQKCCSFEVFGGKSLIQSVFRGRLRSQVKCTRCSHCSNKYDPFLDLSLEVARADSLQKALAHFTATEVLDGDNKYHCSKCKTKVKALKQFTIDQAPPILTVQLKRFSSSGGFGGKIDKKVHFDSNLDLRPFVNGCEDEEIKYALYAVLVHSGWSTHSGHYYCYVHTGMDTWHLMDDSQVSQVSERSVLEQKAYILFYVRKNIKSMIHQKSNCFSINRVNITIPHKKPVDELTGVICKELYEELLTKPDIDDASCPSVCSEIGISITAKEMDEANDCSERSWYRAVEILNSSASDASTVETLVTELACVRHADNQIEDTDFVAQNECLSDDNCKDNVMDPLEDGYRSDNDSSEIPISEPGIQNSRCAVLDATVPRIRTSLFETASHHALNFLCMCAKFCFWSCFWPPS